MYDSATPQLSHPADQQTPDHEPTTRRRITLLEHQGGHPQVVYKSVPLILRLLQPSATRMEPAIIPALDMWKSARTALSHAVQSYLSASRTLCNRCTGFRTTEPGLRGALEAVAAELESITSEIESQGAMCATLAATRNKLARVNTLPPEILRDILLRAKRYCTYDARSTFHDLAGVCSYWRQVALHTRDLWTHVDVGPDTPSKLTRLLLERAGGRPVHLHLYEPVPPKGMFTSIYKIEQTVQTITPYMHLVRELNIESRGWSREFVGTVLNLWLSRGEVNITRSLAVSRPSASRVLNKHSSNANKAIDAESQPAQGILQSLSVLHLQEVQFDWQSTTYHGLVDLRLDFCNSSTSVSVSQLRDILTASPRLEILKLGKLKISPGTDTDRPPPILLANLKVLNVTGLAGDSIVELLPMITLPSHSADLSVGIAGRQEIEGPLLDLLNRSNITLLCWMNYAGPSLLLDAYISISSLRTLIIDFASSMFTYNDENTTQHELACSSLSPPSVILLKATVTERSLSNFVKAHGITDLRLDKCRAAPGCDEALEDIQGALSRSHPGLECSLSKEDSTDDLHCRTMFDLST